MNLLNKEITDGISIFTAVMNRNEFLEKSLKSWLKLNVDEIIIADWNSKESVIDLVDSFKDDRIIVITIPDKKYWILTMAFNVAARCTSKSNILKLDADSLISEDFLKKHQLNGNIFYAGDWRIARNDNEKHLNGIVYVKREDFFKVHGYNEYIQSYGWDDCDLYDRLIKKCNLIKCPLNYELIYHIPHDNVLRSMNQNAQRVDIEIEKNRLLSQEISWNGPILPVINKIQNTSNHYTFYLSNIIPCPSQELIEKCLEQAFKNRNYVKKYKFYIEVQNGLCNRLRALSSAYNIAIASKRDLILIWETNEHCYAEFEDLFDIAELTKNIEKNGISFFLIKDKKEIILPEMRYYLREDVNILYYDYADSKQKNVYINDTVLTDVYVMSACCLVNKHTSWTKESNFLKTMVLSAFMKKIIDEYMSKLKMQNVNIENCIGVHIRMHQFGETFEDISNYTKEARESVLRWRNASHWSVFLSEIKKILQIDPKQMFFLCCDRESTYQSLLKELPNSFIYTEKKVYDRSKDQVRNGLLDIIMLSKTKEILGSNWSTFSEIANRLSGKRMRLAGVDF